MKRIVPEYLFSSETAPMRAWQNSVAKACNSLQRAIGFWSLLVNAGTAAKVTVPANTLANKPNDTTNAALSMVRFEAFGTFSGAGVDKRIVVKIGTSTIFDKTFAAIVTTKAWSLRGHIIPADSTSVHSCVDVLTNDPGLVSEVQINDFGFDMTLDADVNITASAAVVTDVRTYGLSVTAVAINNPV